MTAFSVDLEPSLDEKGVGAFVAIGGYPLLDDEVVELPAPNGVGAFDDMGGYVEAVDFAAAAVEVELSAGASPDTLVPKAGDVLVFASFVCVKLGVRLILAKMEPPDFGLDGLPKENG